jgi:hypothetical protein
MTESTVVLVILLLAAVASGAYLIALVRGDGIRFGRTDPPRSHHPYFDSTAGPTRLA